VEGPAVLIFHDMTQPIPKRPGPALRERLATRHGGAAFNGWSRFRWPPPRPGSACRRARADRCFRRPVQVLTYVSERATSEPSRTWRKRACHQKIATDQERRADPARTPYRRARGGTARWRCFSALNAGWGCGSVQDRSTRCGTPRRHQHDFNFIPKRATLAACTLDLALLAAIARRAAKQLGLLDRRIDDVMKIEKLKSRVRSWEAPRTGHGE